MCAHALQKVRLARKRRRRTEARLALFALVLYEVFFSIQMTTAHIPHGETQSARGMKLPRAVRGLLFH